ncbi:MAG: helix-turn-helix transcriptional regulator [Ruminococcus sp.]|nr:helix-turn-helix transcriptional regulator [Ruminococcus sp.]
MSVIGEQIRKYRIKNGYTQEQLGQMIGVTTQAVSKWERGGLPDTDILPLIAQSLGVSIDALFGYNDENEMLHLARKINHMPDKEAYRYAFEICWAMEIGLMRDISLMEKFVNFFSEEHHQSAKLDDYYSKIMTDGGMATARISPDFRHFFLMTEPADSIKNHIGNPDELRRVFEVFSDEKCLRILCSMYTRLNYPVTEDVLIRQTGMDKADFERCMEILCENCLATKSPVVTLDGEQNAYQFSQESSVIPLLCIADEIVKNIKKDYCDFVISFERKKPLM